MAKIYMFSKVIMKDTTKNNLYGPMIVCEIRTPEEAKYYGSFEIMCRSLQNGRVRDFHESELLAVDA